MAMPDRSVETLIAQTFLEIADRLEGGTRLSRVKIAVTGIGSEHGEQNVLVGALIARRTGVEVIYIGTLLADGIRTVRAETAEEAQAHMEALLVSGEADGAVTMHYPFPIGVATVGRAITPGRGREMYIASTTGTASADRAEAMVRNAVIGIAAAKACGLDRPKVGILNIEGAVQAEAALKRLRQNGYAIEFADSARADKGCLMRGNDLLFGACDVMLCDSLTGNILMKTLSSFTTGGSYESLGSGYGPGLGEGFDKLVLIVSRASGAPVIAGAIEYAAALVEGDYRGCLKRELEQANRAGLGELLSSRKPAAAVIPKPAKEVVVYEITGIKVMHIEEAAQSLWQAGIYAESGMGCTGPVILVSERNAEAAETILQTQGWRA